MSDPATNPELTLRRHREMLLISCSIVVLAFLLQVRPDHRVSFRGLSRYPLPSTCFSRTWLGVSCPGCGLTRSIVDLAHADWNASWREHRLGGVMACVIVIQVPFRWLALRRGGRSPIDPRLGRLFGNLMIALLLGNWLLDFL